MLKKPEIDVNVLVKAASDDMLKSEKGSQWPLSCYGPFQAKPCFPGFEDKSFEEIRLGYYEAQQNGTLDQYKQGLNQILQEAQMKIKVLQNPSPEAVNILKNIYNNNVQNTNNSVFNSNQNNYSNSVFGNTGIQNQNIFANSAPSNSIFANANQNFSSAPANKSIFGGSASGQSVFNSAPNQSVFSQSGFASATNKSPFGAPAGQSIFAAAPPNQNIFASAANNQNLFTNTPTQSIFGAVTPNQNVFASASQNVFASAASAFTSTPSQNVYTSAAPGSIFTSVAPTQNTFVSSGNAFTNIPSQNVFTSAASTPNVFTSTAPTQNIFASSANTFANPGQTAFTSVATTQNIFTGATSSIFGNAPPPSYPNQNPVQNHQSIFSSNQNVVSSNSPFAANANSGNTNIFQQANTGQNSVFGGTGQSHSASIFGNKPQMVVPAPKVYDPTVYSKLSDLTSDDVAQFESRCFEFGKIPIRPPPLEMC